MRARSGQGPARLSLSAAEDQPHAKFRLSSIRLSSSAGQPRRPPRARPLSLLPPLLSPTWPTWALGCAGRGPAAMLPKWLCPGARRSKTSKDQRDERDANPQVGAQRRFLPKLGGAGAFSKHPPPPRPSVTSPPGIQSFSAPGTCRCHSPLLRHQRQQPSSLRHTAASMCSSRRARAHLQICPAAGRDQGWKPSGLFSDTWLGLQGPLPPSVRCLLASRCPMRTLQQTVRLLSGPGWLKGCKGNGCVRIHRRIPSNEDGAESARCSAAPRKLSISVEFQVGKLQRMKLTRTRPGRVGPLSTDVTRKL